MWVVVFVELQIHKPNNTRHIVIVGLYQHPGLRVAQVSCVFLRQSLDSDKLLVADRATSA